MAINELIASGGTPITPDNPIRNALAISQLRGEDIRSGEADRAIRNRNMLNALAKKHTDASGKTDLDAVRAELAAGGNWDMSNVVADKQKQQFADDLEQAKTRQAARNQYLAQATTPEQIMEWHKANHSDPFTGRILADAGITTDKSVATIASLKTPEQIEDFKARALLGSKEMFDRLHQQGQLKIQQGNLAVNQGQLAEEKRWHDMQNKVATTKTDAVGDKVAHVVTNNAGDVTLLDASGKPIGDVLKGAGKPSATYEKTAHANKKLRQDIDSVIPELENLVKKDGLLDKATGSGLGAARDWTASLVGKSTEGAIALGAIAPIYDKVLKMIPRFEGPQSDKDTASYNKAAGDLANPNTPSETKKSAATEILRLMRERRNQFGTKDDTEATSASPSTAPAAGGWGKATVEGE